MSYAMPPTPCRQSHPRRVPADLLSTRNHLLASSIVPGRISQPQIEGKSLPAYTYLPVSLSLIKRSVAKSPPTTVIECQPPVDNNALSSELHAGSVYLYIYDTMHIPTYTDAAQVPATYRNIARLRPAWRRPRSYDSGRYQIGLNIVHFGTDPCRCR